MGNKQLLEWEEEFDKKFDHFNGDYQICNIDCKSQYNLEDIKEWIKINFISRKEMKKKLQHTLNTFHGGGNGRRLILVLLESL